MNVEQIIKQSKVIGIIPDSLKGIHPENLQEMLILLNQVISTDVEYVRIDGIYRIKAIFGYEGKEEFSDNLRVLWRREFPELLPFDSEEEYKPLNNISSFVSDGKKYLFRNADGKYLGSIYKVKNYKSQ